MQSAHYELVARVGKTRGLEGKVTASAAGDLPFALYEGLDVFVVPPSLYGPRELTVERIDESSDSVFTVQFEGVDSIDDAEQIAGRSLLARIEDVDAYDYESYEEIGRTVRDERYGDLGEIVELIMTPANDVWVVDGPHGEVLIPIIEDVVLDIPEDFDEPIRTRVMDGLVGDDDSPHGDAAATDADAGARTTSVLSAHATDADARTTPAASTHAGDADTHATFAPSVGDADAGTRAASAASTHAGDSDTHATFAPSADDANTVNDDAGTRTTSMPSAHATDADNDDSMGA